jgi:hypothetical protein
VSGWPAWFDRVEEIAAETRVDTCPDHMQPFARCRRWHIVRAALVDLWRMLREVTW